MTMEIHTGTPGNVGGLCTVRSKATRIHYRSKYWMPEIPVPFAALPIFPSLILFVRSVSARQLNVRCLVAFEPEIKRKAGRSVTLARRNYRDVERRGARGSRLTNSAYRKTDRLDWYPIYWCCVNRIKVARYHKSKFKSKSKFGIFICVHSYYIKISNLIISGTLQIILSIEIAY